MDMDDKARQATSPETDVTFAEVAGDPDATSEQSAAEGGAATGAVVGALVAGPIGLAVGAALGGVAGAAAGPDEPSAPGDGAMDRREDRDAIHADGGPQRSGSAPKVERADRSKVPVVDIPVVDSLTGHGGVDADRAG